jgi:hypothetical protein
MKLIEAELFRNRPVQSHLPEMAGNTMLTIEMIFKLIGRGMANYNKLHERKRTIK